MPDNTYVSFIGAGNLAWHLAPALDNAGYPVREVYSHTDMSAKKLVNRLYQAEIKTDLNFSASNSSIFIIAVSDDVIAEMAREIILPDDAILAHTSGAEAMDSLSYAGTDNIGVFYPLQTFSKHKKINLAEVPFCIEAGNENTAAALHGMAATLSKNILQLDTNDRKALHIAAAFSSNFVNHFLKIAEDILKNSKLDFNILRPLIAETITKSFEIGPEAAQTGPAKRHDLATLDKHMAYLEHNEAVAELYRIVSQHIIDSYPQK